MNERFAKKMSKIIGTLVSAYRVNPALEFNTGVNRLHSLSP